MSESFPSALTVHAVCCLDLSSLQQHDLLVCTSSLKATKDPEIAQLLGMK